MIQRIDRIANLSADRHFWFEMIFETKPIFSNFTYFEYLYQKKKGHQI